jgi:hypothetical protein
VSVILIQAHFLSLVLSPGEQVVLSLFGFVSRIAKDVMKDLAMDRATGLPSGSP